MYNYHIAVAVKPFGFVWKVMDAKRVSMCVRTCMISMLAPSRVPMIRPPFMANFMLLWRWKKIQLSSCVLLDARKGDDMCFCGAICAAMHVCVCACVRTCVMRACVRDVWVRACPCFCVVCGHYSYYGDWLRLKVYGSVYTCVCYVYNKYLVPEASVPAVEMCSERSDAGIIVSACDTL